MVGSSSIIIVIAVVVFVVVMVVVMLMVVVAAAAAAAATTAAASTVTAYRSRTDLVICWRKPHTQNVRQSVDKNGLRNHVIQRQYYFY